MIRKNFPATLQGLGQTLDLIENTLLNYNMNRKDVNHAILSVDETLVSLIENAEEGSELTCQISYWFGKVTIKITVKGKPIDLNQVLTANQAFDTDMGHEAEEAIRNMLLKRLLRDIKYKYRNGYSTLVITSGHEEKSFILYTLGALALAVVFGLVGRKLLGSTTIDGIDTYFLEPVRTMFLRAINLITAPCIFLAIACAVADFSSYFEFGKAGTKIILSYVATTFIAVIVGTVAFFLLKPGTFGIIQATAEASDTIKISYLDMVINIVPLTIIEPFVSDSTLQLLFFGILCGAALSMIGDYTTLVKQIFNAFSALIGALRSIIIIAFPLAIFCTTAHLFLTAGSDILLSLLQMVFTEIVATFLMIVMYCLMVLFIGRLNPFVFLRKYSPNFIPTLTAASYGVTMSDILNTCKNKLGISSKICSFSVPLGATINMDGNCIYFSIAALFLARISGIELSATQLVVMLATIVILSFGSPGQAGSGVYCLTAVLVQLGVPMESVAFIVSIDAFIGLFRKMSNIVGDVVCSLTVASTEGLVDKKIYYS